jgi:hypothetical protein
MDLSIQRPSRRCGKTDRPLPPGAAFFSALVRAEGRLERVDVAADAWEGPPAGTIAWWRCSAIEAEAAGGPVLASSDVLLDVLEQLEGDAGEESLRYLLGLHLVRRRVLRFTEASSPGNHVVLTCRRRNRDYRLACAPPADPAAAEQRLVALLWSGATA